SALRCGVHRDCRRDLRDPPTIAAGDRAPIARCADRRLLAAASSPWRTVHLHRRSSDENCQKRASIAHNLIANRPPSKTAHERGREANDSLPALRLRRRADQTRRPEWSTGTAGPFEVVNAALLIERPHEAEGFRRRISSTSA